MIYLLPVFISLTIFLMLLYKKNKSNFFYLHLFLLLLFCSFLQYSIFFNNLCFKLNNFIRICIFMFLVFGLPFIVTFLYKSYFVKKDN